MVGAVREEVGGQHELVQVGWQVVVQEQRPVVEEEGHVVDEVAGEQDLPGLAVGPELRLGDVKAEPPPP